MSEYRYRLTSTGASSQKYGVCEVCGKHAAEVFIQTEEKRFFYNNEERWAVQCAGWFGHRECLESRQKV